MALYLRWFSLASIWPDLHYSLKHTSNLRRPDIVSFRLKALEFWDKHVLAAAIDYISGKAVSRLLTSKSSLKTAAFLNDLSD